MIYVILAIIGTLAGVCAALGIGGGFVYLLYFTVVANIPQKEAQLLNLLFFIPVGIVSILLHIRHKLIVKGVAIKAIIGGIAGVFIGVYAATLLPSAAVSKIFAVFILIVGIKEIFSKESNTKKTKE